MGFNWGYPVQIGEGSFSTEGHGEWQRPAGNETDGRQPCQVLVSEQALLETMERSNRALFRRGIRGELWRRIRDGKP